MGVLGLRPATGMATLPQASTPLCELCAATASASHLGNGSIGRSEVRCGAGSNIPPIYWYPTLEVIASGTTAKRLRRTQIHRRISPSMLKDKF